jgi:hypothetical protein
MMKRLAGMTFRAVSNSSNGSLDNQTVMSFVADDGVVVGNYSGGSIAAGHVLARHTGEGKLEMLYQGATTFGEIQAGRATARFESRPDGGMLMRLDWQWFTGDRSSGQSHWTSI